jgi:carbon-monoxide dehydrogenase large subunit
MMERMAYEDGQLLTGSLMDYAVPRAGDMPPIRLFSQPTPSPANPLGVKGVGEAGCIGVPAAILNAVMDALPPGTPDLSLPLTPEKVWRALTGRDQ